MMNENEKTLSFVIVQNFGTLSESGSWAKELNIVQWGENIAKYDIRSWNASHTKSGKGITLSAEEIKALKDILNQIEL